MIIFKKKIILFVFCVSVHLFLILFLVCMKVQAPEIVLLEMEIKSEYSLSYFSLRMSGDRLKMEKNS